LKAINISIVETLNMDIIASLLVDSVVAGTFFCRFILSHQIARDESWEVVAGGRTGSE